MKKTVAVIYGGVGLEASISVMSARSVIRDIDKESYRIIPIFISKSGFWFIRHPDDEDASSRPTYPVRMPGGSGFLAEGGLIRADLAIPLLHGEMGEDGRIQGALETAGIPYLGCDVTAGAITNDKAHTKLFAKSLGIPTAPYKLLVGAPLSSAISAAEEIGFPIFLKPNRRGSSFGAAPAYDRAQMDAAYAAAFSAGGGEVIIEKLVDKKCEIECAYLNDGQIRISTAGAILSGSDFYDYEKKYCQSGGTKATAENRLCRETEKKLLEYCRALIDLLRLRDLARIDFFLTRDGDILFNEINPMPGMTDTSLFPRLCKEFGMAQGEFINRLIAHRISDAGCV